MRPSALVLLCGILLVLQHLNGAAAQFMMTPPPPDPAVPALLVIRQELGSPSPYLDSWLRGGPCDNGGGMHNLPPYWTGITCYTGVWGVNLSNYALSCPLPPSVARIPTLYTVTFNQAGMVGTLPPVWAELPKLMYLDLSNNQLTGTIPDAWGGMTFLRGLNLANNQLTGNIPRSLTALTMLEYVNLMGNPGLPSVYVDYPGLVALIGAQVPQVSTSASPPHPAHHLGAPPPAPVLPAVSTVVTGGPPPPDPSVPALLAVRQELGSPSPYLDSWLRGGPCDNGGGMDGVPPYWTGITCYDGVWSLALQGYPLNRPLPPSVARITSLWMVIFSGAGMRGTLPDSWAALPGLGSLDLSNNDLTGEIPESWCTGLTTLRYLNLAGNKLTGTLPRALTRLTRLDAIDLSGNQFDTGGRPLPYDRASLLQFFAS